SRSPHPYTCLFSVLTLFSVLLLSLHATAPPEFYTLSLHDALPISLRRPFALVALLIVDEDENVRPLHHPPQLIVCVGTHGLLLLDRKSTRLNSSHGSISYAVFCLKKKKDKITHTG